MSRGKCRATGPAAKPGPVALHSTAECSDAGEERLVTLWELRLVELAHGHRVEVGVAVLAHHLAGLVEGPEDHGALGHQVVALIVVNDPASRPGHRTLVEGADPALGDDAFVVDHDPFDVELEHAALVDNQL